jgi:serine/threonine-protein phosphatase 2A regulatory subunit A
LLKKEDDEVLFALAEELGQIFPLIPSYQTTILGYLETLASMEETVVRN